MIFNRNKKTKRERIQHSLSSISVVLIGWGVGQHACRTASETPKLLGHLKHVNVLPLCAAQIVALYSSPVMRSAHNAIAVRASSHPFRPDRPTRSHSPFYSLHPHTQAGLYAGIGVAIGRNRVGILEEADASDPRLAALFPRVHLA